MSKRICFSSVLKDKRGSQNVINKMHTQQQQSLQQIMQEFTMNPNRDYTLRYFQSSSNLRGCSSRQGFEEGVNQLDHWIQNQIQYNKQNISDTQPRRQIPTQLLKFTTAGSKSPRKLIQGKIEQNGFQQPQTQSGQQQGHKNIDMKQICREYIENKRSGRDLGREAPVWKFSDGTGEYDDQEQVTQVSSKIKFQKQVPIIRQSSNTQKFRQQKRLNQRQKSRQRQQQQFYPQPQNSQKPSRIHSQKQLRAQNPQLHTQSHTQSQLQIQSQIQTQGQQSQSSNFIEELKNTMAQQIQELSERIIQDKRFDQEQELQQELLISQRDNRDQGRDQREQRESEEDKDQRRYDKVRREIGEYLNIKNAGSSSDYAQPQLQQPLVKRTTSKTHTPPQPQPSQQPITSSHPGVGYSFSSQFPNSMPQKIASFQKQQKQNNISKISSQQSMSKNKRDSQVMLNPNDSKISLPNIDEVKSERDALERVEDDFGDNVKANYANQNQSIDKNYIKQIQSVAYVDPTPYRRPPTHPEPPKSPAPTSTQTPQQPQKQSPSQSQSQKSSSLLQQVTKTALSVQAGEQDNSVVISVADKDSAEKKSNGKPGSGEKVEGQVMVTPRIGSFVVQGSSPRVQFKKVSSPQVDKIQVNRESQFRKQPNTTKMSAGGQYFSSGSHNFTVLPPHPPININTNSSYKASFTSNTPVLTPATTTPTPNTQTNPTSSYTAYQQPKTSFASSSGIVCPPIIGTATANMSEVSQIITGKANTQPSLASIGNQANNGNNIQSSVSYNQNQYQNITYYQNSRERNNSIHDQTRKLKITISPKYHGTEQSKPDFVSPVVNDFKTKMEDSLDGTKLTTNTGITTTTQPTTYTPYTTTNISPAPIIPTKVSFTSTLNQIPSSMQQQPQTQAQTQALVQPVGPQSSFQNVATKQSISSSGNRFKLDTMFANASNTGNVTVIERREVHQETREKEKEHALIRIQKYEKIQTVNQPAKTKNSISMKNNQSIKSSQQFEFDLDF